MKQLDLRMFDGTTHTLTIYKDNHLTSVTADKEAYEPNEEIKLTITPANGYKAYYLIRIENNRASMSTVNSKIKMGQYNLTLAVISISSFDGYYIVKEPVMININGKRIRINPTQRVSINNGFLSWGGECREQIANSDAVTSLIEQGILIPARTDGAYQIPFPT